jgi:hypothetical protein
MSVNPNKHKMNGYDVTLNFWNIQYSLTVLNYHSKGGNEMLANNTIITQVLI